MQAENFEIIHQIRDAKTVDEVYVTLQKLTTNLGFDYYLHAMKIRLAVSRPHVFVATSFPNSWSSLYKNNKYEARDPLVAHAFLNLTPAIWSDFKHVNPDFFSEAAQHGLHDGIVIPIFGSGGDQGMLSVCTGDKKTDVAQRNDLQELIAILHYLIPILYEQTCKLLKADLYLHDSSLSERERTCLLWTADGKSAWEVAKILGVTERTVRFHIKNASEKLGANTGVHAVTRAISLGEFDGVPANFDLSWDQYKSDN